MNMHGKRHPGSMLLIVLALGALLGACGAEQPTGKTTTTMAGVVTVNTPTAGLNTCMSCHPVTTAEWEKTRHANLNSSPSFTTSAFCAGCHDKTGDSQFLSPARMVVACEACHSGGAMHIAAGGMGPIGNVVYTATVVSGTVSTLAVSGQFLTCTRCHELLDLAGDPASTTTPTTAMHSSTSGSVRVITDTHFAKPNAFSNTSGGNTNNGVGVKAVTGYVMDYASEKVCIDCHNPHGTTDINLEWAQSAHADLTASAGTYMSGAWARSNWSCNTTGTAGCGTSDNRPCQRCHTTAGFIAFAASLKNGDAIQAKSIQRGEVSLVTYTSGWKPEMLKCNACHTDYRGTIRNPGAITGDYDNYSSSTNTITSVMTFTYYSLASHTYPDIAGSNVCMACHIARQTGATLKGMNNAAQLATGTIQPFNFSAKGIVSSHYLSGGGTVFTATGYHFDGRNFENSPYYRHSDIGTPAEPGTGTNGPCIGCHMSRQDKNGNHLFLPVSRDDTGVIGIASEACFTCHGPSTTLILDLVRDQKSMYAAALEALEYVLDKRGFYHNDHFYPLRTNKGTVTMTNGSAAVTGADTLWATSSAVTGSVVTGSVPDYFKVDNDGTYYKIIAVANDTTLTLASPYTGASGTGLPYSIILSGRTSPDNRIKNWLTQVGTGLRSAATTTDTDTTGAKTGKNNMGAAFNLRLLEHEPGAYVHNRIYVKRLIYDSIDWADDNSMNYSVGDTLTNYIPAAAIFRAGARTYLLQNGVLGIPAERP